MFLRGKKKTPSSFSWLPAHCHPAWRTVFFFSKIINKVSPRWPKTQKTLSTRLFSSLKLKLNIKRGLLARTKTRFDMALFKETISEWIFIVRHSCTQVFWLDFVNIFTFGRGYPRINETSVLLSSDLGEFETGLFLLLLRNHCIRQFSRSKGHARFSVGSLRDHPRSRNTKMCLI